MRRIHATNNEFQRYGPKGFMEIKILENDNLYVRVDLPGVPDDGVRHRVDSVRQKVVFFSCEETLSDGDDKKNAREYAGTAGLGCDCCEITGVDAKMKDGMLRMIVSRGQQVYSLFPSQQRYNMDEPALNMAKAVEDHPFVVKGPKRSENSVQRRGDGSVWVSFDLPGVCGDDILVLPNENEVKFYGENKGVYEHDESCRIFMGAVNGA
ncbi:hypothetical protein HID58_048780 [Brassica napus]|uniref:Uncharacterized protein n=1 Tax=Brassica napus TaxID=3708 RepID=A0ABQ8B3Z1_BRANA|nr:hypothetical protein HID58_048780 [Brassica napus]